MALSDGISGRPREIHRPESANYHANALARGLALLEILAAHADPQTLQNFSDETDLPKSTLVRLLAVLSEMGYVVRVDERPSYRLGYRVQPLADAYVRALDLTALVGHYLQPVASKTGQTANLGILEGGQVLHVCVCAPQRPLRFDASIGERDHAYCTGLGKMLLSYLSPEQLDGVLPPEPFPRFTEHTLLTRTELARELHEIRAQGVALDDNERAEGLVCVAVPVVLSGRCLAAVSVSGPAGEFTEDNRRSYVAQLQEVAAAVAADGDVISALWALRS